MQIPAATQDRKAVAASITVPVKIRSVHYSVAGRDSDVLRLSTIKSFPELQPERSAEKLIPCLVRDTFIKYSIMMRNTAISHCHISFPKRRERRIGNSLSNVQWETFYRHTLILYLTGLKIHMQEINLGFL